MPIVQVELIKGRTIEQKQEMVQKITQALVESVNCKPESVSIIIRDMEKENYGHGGELVYFQK